MTVHLRSRELNPTIVHNERNYSLHQSSMEKRDLNICGAYYDVQFDEPSTLYHVLMIRVGEVTKTERSELLNTRLLTLRRIGCHFYILEIERSHGLHFIRNVNHDIPLRCISFNIKKKVNKIPRIPLQVSSDPSLLRKWSALITCTLPAFIIRMVGFVKSSKWILNSIICFIASTKTSLLLGLSGNENCMSSLPIWRFYQRPPVITPSVILPTMKPPRTSSLADEAQ